MKLTFLFAYINTKLINNNKKQNKNTHTQKLKLKIYINKEMKHGYVIQKI